MSRAGHYSGWIKRDSVKRGFTGPIGITTTPAGNKVVKFAKPPSIDARKLNAALDRLFDGRKSSRGAGS